MGHRNGTPETRFAILEIRRRFPKDLGRTKVLAETTNRELRPRF